MSDNNNFTSVSVNFGGHKPVFVLMDIRKLLPNVAGNSRFVKGQTVFGATINVDTMDIGSMKLSIINAMRINEPIWVSEQENGDLLVMRGNRRATAGLELVASPDISDTLRTFLTTSVPVFVFKGLSKAEEQKMVQDQDQKRYSDSELVRGIFEMRRQGADYTTIAEQYWQSLGNSSFSRGAKFKEVLAITDPIAQKREIDAWLTGTLNEYLLKGFDLGPWMQKQMILSVLAEDKLLPIGGETPYFNTQKGKQSRMNKLAKARKDDGTTYSPHMLVEGTKFKALCDEFQKEDYGVKETKVKAESGMSKNEMTALEETLLSNACKQAVKRCRKEATPELIKFDQFASGQEAKLTMLEQHLPHIVRPEIADVLRIALLNPDPTDFATFLVAMTQPLNEPSGETFDERCEREAEMFRAAVIATPIAPTKKKK